MSGNEWPPFDGQEGGEMSNIAASFPSSDVRTRKKEEEVKYHASSLNHAYHQLRKHGLVVVTDKFNKLSEGPKMEVFQDEKRLGNWGLIKAAVKKPARGVIRDGKNWPAECLSGKMSTSSMIPPDSWTAGQHPGGKVVNSCRRRRRQRLTRPKVVQLSNRSLFKGEKRQKKKKKRGKRSKKSKGGKGDADAKERVDGGKMVGSGKCKQKKKGFPEVKLEANKDFDRDAKVCQHYHRSLVSLS